MGFFCFFFNHFFQGSIHSVIFKFADVIIQKITLMSSDIIPLFCHVRGHIWGRNQRGWCQAEFSRTRLAAKFVLTCDSSGLQPGKACCYHSRCITWTVTVQQPHEDVKARFQKKSPASVQHITVSLSTLFPAINCWISFSKEIKRNMK